MTDLIFDNKSWHYKLILWTWGKNFFMDSEIDWKALDDIHGDDLTKISYDGLPRKYKARTVNFCPYCRALVSAIVCSPFVKLWRLLPHKKKEPLTMEGIKKAQRRRHIIIGGGASLVNIAFGIRNLFLEEWIGAATQFSVAVFIIVMFTQGERLGKLLIKLSQWIEKRRKPRTKKIKVKKPPKEISKIMKKLSEKHEIICPPIFFIDKTKPEEHK